MERKLLVLTLMVGMCMLYGCAKSGAPSSDVSVSRPFSSATTSQPLEESSGTDLPPESSSSEPAVSHIEVLVPKTADTGEKLLVRPSELLELNEFLSMTVAPYSSFEYGQSMDDVLIDSGVFLCVSEGKGEELPDGSFGVQAKLFEQLVYEYFDRNIESPQMFNEDENALVRYDGEYYKWEAMGYDSLAVTVGSVEDLGNGFLKCISTVIYEGEYEVESGDAQETVKAIYIVRRQPSSRYKYNLLASKLEEQIS